MPERVLLGHIIGAHGIKGEVRIRAYTEAPNHLMQYGPLTDENGEHGLDLSSVRSTAKGVLASIVGITDRTAAETLRGRGLYVSRDRLPPPAPDDFYIVDLVGLTVLDHAGAPLGHVTGVDNYGAGDILVVEAREGAEQLLVPFLDRYVLKVDLEKSCIVIDPPRFADDDGSPDPLA